MIKTISKLILILLAITTNNSYAQNTISTYAGNGSFGYTGDGASATDASIATSGGLAMDYSGNLYIADIYFSVIRKVTPAGIITTVAGTGTTGYTGDGGAATAAELFNPAKVAVDSFGNLYIGDVQDHVVRKVSAAGIITTIAGNGTGGYTGDGGPATDATLYGGARVAADDSGNVYIPDIYDHVVRKVSLSGIITTIAGNGIPGFSGDNGAATAAQLYAPSDIAIDKYRNIYIADDSNGRVRKITAATGIITTIAGNGSRIYSGDNGPATAAGLSTGFFYLATDRFGDVYITDSNRVRVVNAAGIISTLSGNDTAGYSGDGGPATAALLNNPDGLATDSYGNVYISDLLNYRIRKVTIPGLTTQVHNTALLPLALYPDPSAGIFTIKTENGLRKTIQVYTAAGENVYDRTVTAQEPSVDISSYPDGVYLVYLRSDAGLSFQKIILCH
jgi:sugar lactone lactonase YvrE